MHDLERKGDLPTLHATFLQTALPRLRRTAWGAVLVLALAVTSVSAGPPVGVVLRTGQRFSGTLVAQRTDRVWLEIDGRQYSWSRDEIAVIEFVPGQANQRELSAVMRCTFAASVMCARR